MNPHSKFASLGKGGKYIYYGIFFLLSGIIHYFLCFDYVPQKKKKIIKLPVSMMKLMKKKKVIKPTPKKKETKKKQPKKKQPKKQPKKKQPKKKENKKKPKKKVEKILYKENLEKKLKEELFKKMAELEKRKKEEVTQLKKKMEQEQQKKLKALEELKKKQEALNKNLVEKLSMVTKKLAMLEKMKTQQKEDMKKIRQENKKQMDKEIKEKMKQLQAQNQKQLNKMKKLQEKEFTKQKKTHEEQVKKKKAEMEKLSKTLLAMTKQRKIDIQKTQKEWKNLRNDRIALRRRDKARTMEMQRYKKELQKQLSNEMLRYKKQFDAKLNKERENMISRQKMLEDKIRKQKQLEREILRQKKLISSARKYSPSKEKNIINNQWKSLKQIRPTTLAKHKEYARKFSTNWDKGVSVPSLDFFDSKFKRNLYDIMNFHKMRLIAYPHSKTYFVSIDLSKPTYNGRYIQSNDFSYFRHFSNRTIGVSSRVLPNVIQQIKNSNFYSSKDGSIYMALIFPHSTANYLAWKSVTVCKKFGYNPKDVQICRSFFRRAKTGYWTLIIDSLILKGGKSVQVNDFEANW